MNKVFRKDANQRNKGITLIALVVTIVVLLILAAVSIQMLGGDQGIIKQAVDEKDKTKEKGAKEQIKLGIIAWQAEHYGADIDQDTLMDVINNIAGSTVVKNEETAEINITINGETFLFTEILDEFIKESSKKILIFLYTGFHCHAMRGLPGMSLQPRSMVERMTCLWPLSGSCGRGAEWFDEVSFMDWGGEMVYIKGPNGNVNWNDEIVAFSYLLE